MVRIRRASPLWLVAGAGIVLLLVGCLHLGERGAWRGGPEVPVKGPPDRLVRVRLGGNTPRRGAALEITSPYSVKSMPGGEVLTEHHGELRSARVEPEGPRGIRIGGERISADDILITPERDAAIVLDNRDSGTKDGPLTYRGALRIQRCGDGLVFDNHLDVESYVRGVVRGELPRDFHPESFKAQAVAARTYVLYQKKIGSRDRTFDVYDHEGSQMYIGVQGEDQIAVDAVTKTAGEVCVYNDGKGDRIFCTYYSSACGGCSQCVTNVKPNETAIPPLAGNVPCNDCYLASFYRWDPVELSKAEVTRKLAAKYPSLSKLGTITELEPKAKTADGRIIRILLIGSTGQSETLVGEDFRLSIGGRVLKSTNFEIETRADRFIFKNGKGFGHGVGLCQHGMETKARHGLKYREILRIYYPRADIKKLY